jgi:hypothetical protein
MVSLLLFGSFAPHFQIKLSIHGSNLNSIIMSELELFLLTRVLTQTFNTMDLVKFLEKNQKLHIKIVVVTLKVTSCNTMSKKKKVKKKSEKPRFYTLKYIVYTFKYTMNTFKYIQIYYKYIEIH